MKIELLKDQVLYKGGLKKKKGAQLIVHNDKGIKMIKDGKAKRASKVKESIKKIFKHKNK